MLNTGHVTGGGFGALIGVIIATLLRRFGHYSLSDADAVLLGSACVSAGIGIGHGVFTHGITGLFREIWRGQTTTTPPKVGP